MGATFESETVEMTRMREILISVAGLTPQIITESLYCLTQTRNPPARISEIWVITTVAGGRKVEDELLLPRKGWFFRFCNDFDLDSGKIRFGLDQILVISDKDGRAWRTFAPLKTMLPWRTLSRPLSDTRHQT